jgi:uncharacterized protein (TIGR02145 family)
MNISNKGFTPIIVLIIFLLTAGLGCYVYFQSQDNPTINMTITVIDSNIIATATTTTLATTIDWACGDSIIFFYKGNTAIYGTVFNSYTGECWMDRNLGASQVATKFDDAASYGDLFQWGRLDDGHQDRNSKTTFSLSHFDNPGHSKFIRTRWKFNDFKNEEPYDWRSPQNNNLWQGVLGINNPCSSGWRLPTSTELDDERKSWITNDEVGAYDSVCKWTVGGTRHLYNSKKYDVGEQGYYWSSTGGNKFCEGLSFSSYHAIIRGTNRSTGYSVRCIKD